jgi:hypothetical protein
MMCAQMLLPNNAAANASLCNCCDITGFYAADFFCLSSISMVHGAKRTTPASESMESVHNSKVLALKTWLHGTSAYLLVQAGPTTRLKIRLMAQQLDNGKQGRGILQPVRVSSKTLTKGCNAAIASASAWLSRSNRQLAPRCTPHSL